MDEEDAGPSAATSSYFSTKNEVVEATITVPDLEQVGPEEHLELVGEILNILDNAVIIKGAQGGSDRALDADTLLVFEDRKVLGYVRHYDFVCCLNLLTTHVCARYSKRLDQQHNPCTRSNSTLQPTHWTQKKSASHAMSITSLGAVISSLYGKYKLSEAATRVT